MKYHKAAVGGTFDHFHAGHKQLLDTALGVADQIVVGITNPKLIQTKQFPFSIESYSNRLRSVTDYCRQKNSNSQFVELFDSAGPTLTDSSIDVLVVSQQTQDGATWVNQQRSSLGMSPLPVVVASMVPDEIGEYISSTSIRSGKITRSGKVFKKLFDQNIVFSSFQLEQLKTSQGIQFDQARIIGSIPVVLVGDMVTQHFLGHQLPFNYALIDGQTRRQPTPFSYPNLKPLTGHNPSGEINPNIAHQILAIDYLNSANKIYQVDGEEDLLAFVPCLSLPLGSLVLYGQPQIGIVMIELTEKNKLHFAQFIDPKI